MYKFLMKRSCVGGDEHKPSTKAAKTGKPKDEEYVGRGAPSVLDSTSLAAALAHLESADPKLRSLIERARGHDLVDTAPGDAHFIYLSEFVVRRRLAVAAANTVLGKLRGICGTWTPGNVMQHEAAMHAYMASGESHKKVETLVALSCIFASEQGSDLDAMTDVQIATGPFNDVKGIGPVALRTLLVRMGRPNVLVAGDGLVNKWMQENYGIDKDKTDAATERARVVAAAKWEPWRSVVYLLINHAKAGTSHSAGRG
jgi:3-methyladenine DNA glycosylase/8-oxoguanine DNA glycosylase